jgi:hypothetical protein
MIDSWYNVSGVGRGLIGCMSSAFIWRNWGLPETAVEIVLFTRRFVPGKFRRESAEQLIQAKRLFLFLYKYPFLRNLKHLSKWITLNIGWNLSFNTGVYFHFYYQSLSLSLSEGIGGGSSKGSHSSIRRHNALKKKFKFLRKWASECHKTADIPGSAATAYRIILRQCVHIVNVFPKRLVIL